MKSKNWVLNTIIFVSLMYIITMLSQRSVLFAYISFIIPSIFISVHYDTEIKKMPLVIIFTIIASAFLPGLSSLFISFITLPLSSLLIMYLRKKDYHINNMLKASLSVIVGSYFVYYITMDSFGLDMLYMFKKSISELSVDPALISLTANMNVSVSELESEIKNSMLTLIPSIYLSGVFIYVFINEWLATKMLKSKGEDVRPFTKFKDMRMPEGSFSGLLVLLVLAWITTEFRPFPNDELVVNTLLLVLNVFAFQGAAVCSFFLDKIRIKGFLQIIFITLIVIIFQVYGLIVIGWLDSVMNVRKLESRL